MNQPAPVPNSIVNPLPNVEVKAETQKTETQKPENAGHPARVGRGQPRATKKGIERRMPAAVRRALEKEIVSASEVGIAWVNQLDEQFGLGQKYGVTKPGLRGLIHRVRVRHGKEVKALRDRQIWTNALLKQVLGEKGKNNPGLLGQHAYLAIVSVLYERLATRGKDISTEELATLSKMLAEQRRAEAQSGGETLPGQGHAEGELPEDFPEVVKQIYGTNFQGNRQ